MCKFNHKNLLLVALLSTLFTNLNAYALEQRTAPEPLIKAATYLDGGTTPDGQRIVLMQVEKSEYADKIEISDNNPSLYNFPESWQLKGNMYSFLLSPQAQTITVKATGKHVKRWVRPRLVWDWGWESRQFCRNLPWIGHRCITTRLPKFVSKLLPGYHAVFKYKDQLVELSLAEHMTELGDISLSVSRESDTEQLVIASQFEPLANAKSYQQVCTSDDGHTISDDTTEFNANSLSASVDHYGRSYRCTVNATIKSPRSIFKEFVRAHHRFPDLFISVLDKVYRWLDAQDESLVDKFIVDVMNELPSYIRDGSEATLVSAEQVIDVPLQHRYAFNQEGDQQHYDYSVYPTQALFEEALAEAQMCHSPWCLALGNGDTLILYSDYNLPTDQADQASNRHAYTYTLYLANFEDDQTTTQVLHQISSSKQLAKMIPLDAQPVSDTNVYTVLLSYRDKHVADRVHITENLDEREAGSLATIYSATSTHVAPIDSHDKIMAMPVIDIEADLGQTLLATYNPQTKLLSVQGYDHHGNLIESDYISGAVGDLALPLDRLWIDYQYTAQDATQETSQDSTENTPLRSLNIVDNHGTYRRFTGAENALYTSELIDEANRKPLIQLTTSGEQCKNYYLDEVEDEIRFVAYPDCMLTDRVYISANNQKPTYLSSHNNSHNNSHNHQLACYQDNDAATEDATTEKVHCHRHNPVVGLHNPAYDFIDVETNSFRLNDIMLQPSPDTSSSIGRYPTYIEEINNKNNNDKFMLAFRPTMKISDFDNYKINWNVYRDGLILKHGGQYFGSFSPISISAMDQIEYILDLIGSNRDKYLDLHPGVDKEEEAERVLDDVSENINESVYFQNVHVVNSSIDGSQLFAFLMKDLKNRSIGELHMEYNSIMNGRDHISMSTPYIWPMKDDTYIYQIPFCLKKHCRNNSVAYIQVNGSDNRVAFDQLMPRYGKDRTLQPSNITLKLHDKILILQVGEDLKTIRKYQNAEGTFDYVTTVVRGRYNHTAWDTIGLTDPQHASAESLFNNFLSRSQAGGLLDDQLLAQIEPLYAPVKAKVLLAEWFIAIRTQEAFPITDSADSSELWSKTASMISEKVGIDITGFDDADSALRLSNQLMAIAQLAGLSMPEFNSHLSSLFDGTMVFDDQFQSNLEAEVNHIKQGLGLTDEVAQIIERSIKQQWELARSASEQKIDTITAGLGDSIAGLYLPVGSDPDYKFYQLSEGNNETIKDIIAIERTEKSIEWVVAREGRLPNVSLRIDRDSESQKNKLDLWIDGKPFQIAPLFYQYPDEEIVSSLGSLLSKLQDFIDIAAEDNVSNGQLTDKFNRLDRQVLTSHRAIFCPPTPTSTAHGPIVGEGNGDADDQIQENNDEDRDTIEIPIGRGDICQVDIQAFDIESFPPNSDRELISTDQTQVANQLYQHLEQEQNRVRISKKLIVKLRKALDDYLRQVGIQAPRNVFFEILRTPGNFAVRILFEHEHPNQIENITIHNVYVDSPSLPNGWQRFAEESLTQDRYMLRSNANWVTGINIPTNEEYRLIADIFASDTLYELNDKVQIDHIIDHIKKENVELGDRVLQGDYSNHFFLEPSSTPRGMRLIHLNLVDEEEFNFNDLFMIPGVPEDFMPFGGVFEINFDEHPHFSIYRKIYDGKYNRDELKQEIRIDSFMIWLSELFRKGLIHKGFNVERIENVFISFDLTGNHPQAPLRFRIKFKEDRVIRHLLVPLDHISNTRVEEWYTVFIQRLKELFPQNEPNSYLSYLYRFDDTIGMWELDIERPHNNLILPDTERQLNYDYSPIFGIFQQGIERPHNDLNLPSRFERLVDAMRNEMMRCSAINCIYYGNLLLYNILNYPTLVFMGMSTYEQSVVYGAFSCCVYCYFGCFRDDFSPSAQSHLRTSATFSLFILSVALIALIAGNG